MKKIKYKVVLTREELRIIRDGMLYFRNELISRGKPTEDVDEILIRLMK